MKNEGEYDEDTSTERPHIVIEVKDVSGKLLYGEAQAQKQYMTMMQASISHGCSQPLAGIIYQLQSLQKLLKKNFQLYKSMEQEFEVIYDLFPDRKLTCMSILKRFNLITDELKFSCR